MLGLRSPMTTATESEMLYPLFESDTINVACSKKVNQTEQQQFAQSYKRQIVWKNVITMAVSHALAIYGFYLFPRYHMETYVFLYFLALLSSLGVQAGAHRLWSHRSYKANFGLRLFLSFCHLLSMQNDLYEWVRDHRAHHRFADTDADPHNSSRGFFFSHIGWLLVKKHPAVIQRGKTINMDDLKLDPIVMFQRQYYIPMILIVSVLLPTVIPWYFWNEPIVHCLVGCVFMRTIYTLNLTWLVNSWSHMYGTRPYDSKIASVESSIRHMLMGEGFHNYHHAFPWDYSASELGPLDVFNPCTAMINLFAKLGWAWDLKKVNPLVVSKKVAFTGNPLLKYRKGSTIWEWSTGIATAALPLTLFFIIKQLSVSEA